MMKNLLLILATLLIATATYAKKEQKEKQEKDVPTEVKAAITTKYPDVKTIKWYNDTTNAEDYNATFKQDKYNYSIIISASGSIKKTEADIDVSDLPAAIMTYINANYPGAQIKKAKRTDVIVDSKGTILYAVEIDKKDTPIVFDANGSLVQ